MKSTNMYHLAKHRQYQFFTDNEGTPIAVLNGNTLNFLPGYQYNVNISQHRGTSHGVQLVEVDNPKFTNYPQTPISIDKSLVQQCKLPFQQRKPDELYFYVVKLHDVLKVEDVFYRVGTTKSAWKLFRSFYDETGYQWEIVSFERLKTDDAVEKAKEVAGTVNRYESERMEGVCFKGVHYEHAA